MLNILEVYFITILIFKLLFSIYKCIILLDRWKSNIIINKGKNDHLLLKLSKKQKVFFRLGIIKYIIYSLLECIFLFVFNYFIICQLELTSFLKITEFFEYIDSILDKLITFSIFENNDNKFTRIKFYLNVTCVTFISGAMIYIFSMIIIHLLNITF